VVNAEGPNPSGVAGNGSHRVVVVGGGFGGLQAALKLRAAPVEVTLIDRRNFHLFQPLTYQVATGALSAAEVAYPLRRIFRGNPNVRVLMANVTGFDLQARRVRLAPSSGAVPPPDIPYDSLIVAGGSRYSYFGHDAWAAAAPEVKTPESALAMRRRLLTAFEAAEAEPDPAKRAIWLTFVVVGGGPTGVEMAGQIAELARNTLPGDFRAIDPRVGRVLLIDMADRVLTDFPPSLSKKAASALEELGVTPLLRQAVVDIDKEGVTIESPDHSRERIPARTIVWAAGVTASDLAGTLGGLAGADVDRAGRVLVEPDLSLRGHPEVFAVGDMVRVRGADGNPVTYPGVAPVAMQEGRHAARVIIDRLRGQPGRPFRYVNKGNLATIGRAHAVADLRGLRLSGLLAWLAWLFVHIWYLIGFQNRVVVLIRWSASFVTHGRGARIILGDPGAGADLRQVP
jgi:NADH dehydrogenase